MARAAPLSGTAAKVATLVGMSAIGWALLHLLACLLVSTRDPFHFSSPEPGPRQYAIGAGFAIAGVVLLVSGGRAAGGHRASLWLLIPITAIESGWLLAAPAGHAPQAIVLAILALPLAITAGSVGVLLATRPR